jgi:hypothetical protein
LIVDGSIDVNAVCDCFDMKLVLIAMVSRELTVEVLYVLTIIAFQSGWLIPK